jgi:probable rRNA maturation factor
MDRGLCALYLRLAAQLHLMITIEPPSTIAASPDFGLSKAGLARFLNRARAAVGIKGEVHVLLADDATLRRLNRTFRGKNKATDVLSFPAGDAGNGNGVGVAGDLAISLETAARQAAQFGHSLRDEVRVLLLHGTLHLAGFDHEADAGEMAAREAELRRELRVETSLIARVSGSARTRTEADSSAPLRNDKQKNMRNDKLKNKQQQMRNAGILRFAQNDKRNNSARKDRRTGGRA